MILEHADIRIDPAKAAAFEEAITRGASTVIAQASGFQGYKPESVTSLLGLG